MRDLLRKLGIAGKVALRDLLRKLGIAGKLALRDLLRKLGIAGKAALQESLHESDRESSSSSMMRAAEQTSFTQGRFA